MIRSIGDSPAVLLNNHGVFTVGPTPEAAVKAAVLVEDAARTMYFALLLGEPKKPLLRKSLAPTARYPEEYGQP